jgi:GT2 family glycosyltransferase
LNGHKLNSIGFVRLDRYSRRMLFEVFHPKPLFERDFYEAQANRNLEAFHSKLQSRIQNAPSRRKRPTLLKYLPRAHRLLKKHPHLLRVAKKLFPLLPQKYRNLIFSRIAPQPQLISGDPKNFYSLDLGIGLLTSQSPVASLIIPVHNAWWTTLDCLRALQRNLDSTPYEVILVDDASSDWTVEAAQAIRGIKLVRFENNVGYLMATNTGASLATGKYLVLLNNDTEPISGWLDSLINTIESNPGTAIVGSRLVYPDGRQQEAGAIVFSSGNAWNLGRYQDPFAPEYASLRETDYCSAASVLVLRQFWLDVGGFDERYKPAYCEDSDLCFAAWSMGMRVLFDPDSWVIHHEGVSHGTDTSSGLKQYQITNGEKLRKKWEIDLESHWKKELPRLEFRRDSKGIVVIIDRQLPAITRDSGSIRTVQIAETIQNLGFHVIISAIDSSTTLWDVHTLRRKGIEVHGNLDSLYRSLESRASRITHFWIIRTEVYEHVHVACKELNSKATFISDLLDLDYVSDDSGNTSIAKAQLNVASNSNATVLVSEFESEILLSKLSAVNIHTIWAAFDLSERTPDWDTSSGLLFVGGFRHSPNVSALKWFADFVLPGLKSRGFNEEIRVAGSGMETGLRTELTKKGMTILGGVADLDPLYTTSRIAILPLIQGKGKKGKLGEALAYGIPVITTSIGAESFGLVNNVEAFIFDDPEVWIAKILEVCSNQTLWTNISKNGRKYAFDNLSRDSLKNRIKTLLEKPI